jgi:glycosyltransferase involved in cell wall biosynthesis
MKIAVNLLPFRKHLAGVGKYAQNIVLELSKTDKVNDYYLFVTNNNQQNFQINQKNFHTIRCGFNSDNFILRIIWEQFVLPFQLNGLKVDLLFTPSVAIPILYRGKMYTTIHDIAYKKVKSKYPFLRRLYVSFITKQALIHSDSIFTVSNFSKSEILAEYPWFKKDITVTYSGVDWKFFTDIPAVEINKFKMKYSLPENFLLYVGAIEPGKNIDTIMKTFADYRAQSSSNMFLVMTGSIGWKKEKALNKIHELGLSKYVVILPYIEEAELPLLYKSANLVLYISAYEGFGLPVLEGMAAGAPVIASASHAVKEFAGDAVSLIDPHNVADIKEKIESLSIDSDFRTMAITKGKLLAQNFTWEKIALNVYLSFIKNQPKC